jgi:hypothetical protein
MMRKRRNVSSIKKETELMFIKLEVIFFTILFLMLTIVCHGTARGSYPSSKRGAVANIDDSYLFPTDASHTINSGFADYRSSHFHGGIDISTNRKIGYPVFAAKRGYVYRVSVSPFGYGKMVILRHEDSTYTLYAHLSRFSNQIERIVDSVQKSDGKYSVDLRLKPNEIRVARGELIAYTGATGVGGPHLHFEVRDKDNSMIDPLLFSTLNVTSYRRPKIFGVAVREMVSGKTEISKVIYSNGEYYAKRTFRLDEPFYFIIHAADSYGLGKFKRPPKYALLKIDGKNFISLNLTRIDADNYLDIGSLVDLSLSRRSKTHYALCVNRAMPFSVFSPALPLSGIIDGNIGNGTHTYEIIIEDERNNRASLTGKFVLDLDKPGEENSELSLYAEQFKGKTVRVSPDLSIDFPDNCFARNIEVDVRMLSNRSFEITASGEKQYMQDYKWLRKKVKVTWKVDDQKLRLYRKSENHWQYVDCKNDGRILTAEVGYRIGEFALLRDDEPPVIGKIGFSKKNPFYRSIRPTELNKVFVYFKVSDELSGVNPDKIFLNVGNRNFLCEYDVDKRAAVCQIDVAELKASDHITAIVSDNAGNQKRLTSPTKFLRF